MKKFCLFLLLCFVLQVRAQGVYPEHFEHVIDVKQYSDWGKGYLTITDNHTIYCVPSYETIPLTFECIDGNNQNNPLPNGWIILEVDGTSAKGWTASQFYEKVDNRNDVITLKIRSSKPKDEIVKLRPIYELPETLMPYSGEFAKLKGLSGREKREDYNKKNKEKRIMNNELYDNDFDFFPLWTYDFLITSNNPLLDKSILDKVVPGWMKRDEKNPDIIFTIARDASESISTTYVPPTSRTVNVGSKTTTQYNYILKENEYITTQKNRTITEGGYTQETKTADLFLEIAALDAKRVNDPKMTHPPVVWQSTTKRHVVDPEFNYDDELRAYASWCTFPSFDRAVYINETIYAPLGVICESNDPKVIVAVKSGSRAERAGLKPGDKLIKAESVDGWKEVKKEANKNGWKALDRWPHGGLIIEIKRGNEKMKYHIEPLSIEIHKSYWK